MERREQRWRKRRSGIKRIREYHFETREISILLFYSRFTTKEGALQRISAFGIVENHATMFTCALLFPQSIVCIVAEEIGAT